MRKMIGLLATTLVLAILVSGCLGGGNGIVDKAISGDIETAWCISGVTWDYAEADATLTWEIIGEEQFKDATYCKVKAVAADEAETVNVWYYVSEKQDDIWYVMELPDGTTQETHVVSPAE